MPFNSDDEFPDAVPRVRLTSARLGARVLAVEAWRPTNDAILLRLEGVADRDVAATWTGAVLALHMDDLPPLADGELYLHELEGARVVDEHGAELGVCNGVRCSAGQELLTVATARGERLLNAAGETLQRYDRATRTLTVRVFPGLWDEA